MAIGEIMSALLQEEGGEGSSVGEMINSVMPEEQVMAVLGSLRSALNKVCSKLEQTVSLQCSIVEALPKYRQHVLCQALFQRWLPICVQCWLPRRDVGAGTGPPSRTAAAMP